MEIEDLIKLKETIEEKTKKIAVLEGRLEEKLNQLKSELGCSTIKEAEKKYKNIQKDRVEKEEILKNQLADFEKKNEKFLNQV